MKNKKIVFMGTPFFAKTVLQSLVENNFNVTLVVTQPDKEVGRKKIKTFSEVKKYALEKGIEIFQPLKIRNDFQRVIAENPDIIITAAYGQIIPTEILNLPKFKCINLHASILPKYRGGAPIQRSIQNGEQETGISLMYMNEKMDEGDILKIEKIKIDEKDTSLTLFEKLSILASKMIIENLPLIFNNELLAIPQEHDKATYAYNLKKSDEFINFNRDVKIVYNHIRSLINNPIGYGIINNLKLKFHSCSYSEKINGKVNEFIGLIDDSIAIGCDNGTILIDKIQLEGKNILNAKDFYNGIGKKLKGEIFNEQQN